MDYDAWIRRANSFHKRLGAALKKGKRSDALRLLSGL